MLAEEPGFTSDGVGKPYERSARVTSTYNLVLINANTGAFILRMGGELLDGQR
jgi:hypothetical protein